ncbi:MAG: GyrI-like domain-containing protein [Alphaproteobacteria bacterium]|nr:GyrI-like domain-containing protein [Alphaproteobacteria bacterium]
MEKTTSQLPEIKLVGFHLRTNNKAEMDPLTAKISPCVQQYFQGQWAEKIPHRTHPGKTLCAYTNYESDYMGDYTFYIGEEVSSLEGIPEGLESHIIPPQIYVKFTTQSGPMPMVLINAWQNIWKMSPESLGGERRYHTDFEIYDERASNPPNTILDIYIGVK